MWTRWLPLACLCVLCLCALTGDARQTSVRVTVTAYSSGTVTASGTRVKPGYIALSRDVEQRLGVKFGDRIELEGIGTFEFQDRMPKQWHARVDLYLPPKTRARLFGIRHSVLLSVLTPIVIHNSLAQVTNKLVE